MDCSFLCKGGKFANSAGGQIIISPAVLKVPQDYDGVTICFLPHRDLRTSTDTQELEDPHEKKALLYIKNYLPSSCTCVTVFDGVSYLLLNCSHTVALWRFLS